MKNINGICTILIGLCFIDTSLSTKNDLKDFPKAVKDDDVLGTLPTTDKFIPAVMQALFYYTEMLQYEQLLTTTVEPPLGETYADTGDRNTPPMYKPTPTASTTRRTTTTTTRTTPRTTTKRTTITRKSTTRTPPHTTTNNEGVESTTPTFLYSTILDIWFVPQTTANAHKPGMYSPQKPPVVLQKPPQPLNNKPVYTRSTTTRAQFTTTSPRTTTRATTKSTTERPTRTTTARTTKYYGTPSTTTKKPKTTRKPWPTQRPPAFADYSTQKPQAVDVIKDPDWKDPSFVEWFFQKPPLKEDVFDENRLQQLAPLPKKLLQDIHKYYLKPPALLPTDNVIEFRKVFDDSYNRQYKTRIDPNTNKHQMEIRMQMQMQQKRPMLTGNKKVPITKPYVEFLMLYDALKREAKTQKLHQFGGFGPELMKALIESSEHSSEWQLHWLLTTMLENGESERTDVITRTQSIIADLENPYSITSKALRYIPALVFLP